MNDLVKIRKDNLCLFANITGILMKASAELPLSQTK